MLPLLLAGLGDERVKRIDSDASGERFAVKVLSDLESQAITTQTKVGYFQILAPINMTRLDASGNVLSDEQWDSMNGQIRRG
jgi:hypothetical protein